MEEERPLTKPLYSAPTPSFFAIFATSTNVHPIFCPAGIACARLFQTSQGVLSAVPTNPPMEPATKLLRSVADDVSAFGRRARTWKMQPK